jgi:hypothetical protein
VDDQRVTLVIQNDPSTEEKRMTEQDTSVCKLPTEWARLEGVKILDADGFTSEEWGTPTTFLEYARRRDECTLEMSVYAPDAATSKPDGTW